MTALGFEVGRERGILISMCWDDHPPPHFHADYQRDECLYEIATCAPWAGSLPTDRDRAVRSWRRRHRLELHENWRRVTAHQRPTR